MHDQSLARHIETIQRQFVDLHRQASTAFPQHERKLTDIFATITSAMADLQQIELDTAHAAIHRLSQQQDARLSTEQRHLAWSLTADSSNGHADESEIMLQSPVNVAPSPQTEGRIAGAVAALYHGDMPDLAVEGLG